LTPELRTMTQRRVDVRNQRALAFNEDWRMFWGDITRVTLTDRPSRLSPEPVPW